jgi:hypothetical protein
MIPYIFVKWPKRFTAFLRLLEIVINYYKSPVYVPLSCATFCRGNVTATTTIITIPWTGLPSGGERGPGFAFLWCQIMYLNRPVFRFLTKTTTTKNLMRNAAPAQNLGPRLGYYRRTIFYPFYRGFYRQRKRGKPQMLVCRFHPVFNAVLRCRKMLW